MSERAITQLFLMRAFSSDTGADGTRTNLETLMKKSFYLPLLASRHHCDLRTNLGDVLNVFTKQVKNDVEFAEISQSLPVFCCRKISERRAVNAVSDVCGSVSAELLTAHFQAGFFIRFKIITLTVLKFKNLPSSRVS